MTRHRLLDARRVVVKVGTSSLSDPDGRLDRHRVEDVVGEVETAREMGREVVLVSSGAIAAGLAPLGLVRRPQDMPSLQAAAAVGQSYLMDAYASGFAERGHVCGQILLTRHDMHRPQYVNALNTFQRLLALGAIPVVNENDTIATHEIRFGENDLLAALVANLVRADALVLLSDVDGLHRGPGGSGELVDEVTAITPDIEALATGKGSALATGGMRSKLEAARTASRSGIAVVIARMRRGALREVLSAGTVGTFVHPASTRLASRKAWIAFATVTKGRVVVDAGARDAICGRNRSLLAAGVRGVEGAFIPGDPVDVVDEQGVVFARGLVSFSAEELRTIAGRGSEDIARALGGPLGREVVHRDELVVL